METLNTLEKVTLLISVCIVAGANLFVLHGRIKKWRNAPEEFVTIKIKNICT